jgi:hypothetical protein
MRDTPMRLCVFRSEIEVIEGREEPVDIAQPVYSVLISPIP